MREPTAMAIATVSGEGDVHQRVVLCKSWSEDGFVFYSNYNSRKGRDLGANPHIGAVFYWDPMFRQVKITGVAEKTSRADSEAYWASRPRASQLSQYVSRQSEPCESREALERAWREAETRFHGHQIPCPEHWGGYLLRTQQIEFWMGRENRLHDAYSFEKAAAGWTFRRLYP
ncbi:MAG TPA: pyridoxamine 5'-phosphate oxidase [Bdellovibrionales bacterium]|nr:pyridoxamine 5'-phosphate oxidase [Bdellovibrionales bacterium]